jgi:hypothetical protein
LDLAKRLENPKMRKVLDHDLLKALVPNPKVHGDVDHLVEHGLQGLSLERVADQLEPPQPIVGESLMAFYSYRGLLFSERPNRWEWLNYAVQAAAIPLMAWAFGAWGLGFLTLSVFFSLSLHPVAAHFVHEHYVFHSGQETYSYYGPFNRITFNVGYHVEHHDFMNIPGSRLPQLHRRLARIYQPMASHSSWTALLIEFIWRTDVGVQSRIVR